MKNYDADLIQRTIEGDQQAFTVLVEKYQKQIHALAWQKIGDFHIAQEIAQDTFLTAYQKLTTLSHHSQFAGWLYVIANNKCKNWHRKKRLALESLEETDPVELEEVYYSEYMTHQREEAANQKQRAIVQKLLSKLQESERTVVNLYYIAEMTCEDIGKFLGVSPNTVMSRLHRARNRLRKEESVIKENLNSFQLPNQLTENIMKEISRLNPVAPSGSKPLVPLAISAVSAIIVLLLIGFGTQNLIRFQKPFSMEATSEQTIEIVDTRIILESPAKPAVNNQVGRSDVLSKNDGTEQKPGTSLFAASQSNDADSSKFKGSWRQTSGPYGGEILTLYETTNGVLLTGTDGAGIFRSTDHGNSWTPVNTGLYNEPDGRSLTVSAIAEKGDKIYIGTQEALYISTDIGNTWQPVPAIRVPGKISGIVILDDHIYVSTLLKGVWQSKDGNSWAQINDGLGITLHGHLLDKDLPLGPNSIGLNPMHIFKLTSVGTTLLVAATKKGFFRRMTNEDTWTPIKPVVVEHSDGDKSENNSKDKTKLNPSHKQDSSSDLYVESLASMNHLLFLSGSIGKISGLFRSNDAGDTWTLITPEIVKEESDDVQTITVQGERLYIGTSDGLIYLSNDMGDSWVSMNDGVMYDDVLTLLPINDNTVFVGTSDNGVFRTTDAGDSWVECNTGIINTNISKLEVIGDKLYTVVGKNIVYSADGGDTWLPVNDPSKQSKYAYFSPTFCVSDGELYIGGYFGDSKFILSDSGGEEDSVYRLNRENNTLVELFTHRDLFLIESMDGIGNTIYMGTWESGVFQWDQKTGITKLGLENHYISVLSANSESVIAVTGDNEIYRFKENSWEPIHIADMIDDQLSDLKWVGSTLYATFWENGVFRSMDGGDSWTSINDGLDDTTVTSIGTDGTEVYVSTFPNGTNVFQWIEEKQHWKSIGSLPKQVSSLAVVDGFLYAGTYGSGVYKIRIEK